MNRLSFDGFGINDKSDPYAPRVATFTKPQYSKAFGKLFEAAPELAEALWFYANPENWIEADTGIGSLPAKAHDYGACARAALAKAGIK